MKESYELQTCYSPLQLSPEISFTLQFLTIIKREIKEKYRSFRLCRGLCVCVCACEPVLERKKERRGETGECTRGSPTHKGGSVSACEHVCQWERVRKLGKDKNIKKICKHSQLGSLMLLVLQDWFKVWKTHWIKLFADFSCQLSRNHGIENLKSNVWETTGFLKMTLGNFLVIFWLVLDRKYCPLYWKCEFWNFCPLSILGCMNLNWHIWLVILSWNIPCQHSIKSAALWISTFMEVWKLKVTASYPQFLL